VGGKMARVCKEMADEIHKNLVEAYVQEEEAVGGLVYGRRILVRDEK